MADKNQAKSVNLSQEKLAEHGRFDYRDDH